MKDEWQVIAREAWDGIARYYGIQIADGTGIEHILDSIERSHAAQDDTKRMNWIEQQSDGSSWIARQSRTGRGFRLHNTGSDCSWSSEYRGTAREAIDVAMSAETSTDHNHAAPKI